MENKQYANLIGWTDITPFEIIKKTTKTLTLRMMDFERNKNWNPVIIEGGFVGHCVNNSEQQWIITSNPNNLVVKAYLRKDGYYSRCGKHIVSDIPIRKYDYNF